MEITQGDGQTGAVGGRLEEYLAVKVTDWKQPPCFWSSCSSLVLLLQLQIVVLSLSPAQKYILMLLMRWRILLEILLMASLRSTATANKPSAPANTVFVQTDNGGVAKVYLPT